MTVAIINAINIAIPPRFGVTEICDVRLLGTEHRFLALAIVTIEGMVNQVIPKASKNPRSIRIQKGREREEMLKGKFTMNTFSFHQFI